MKKVPHYRNMGIEYTEEPTLSSIQPSGEEWFRLFRVQLSAAWRSSQFDSVSDDRQWTKTVLKSLEKWGKSEGYHVRRSEKSVRWIADGSTDVYIEHLIEGDNWDSLRNQFSSLVASDARIKALIIYARPTAYPAREQADKLQELLDKNKNWGSEFLLIVSPWPPENAESYVAYSYRPAVKTKLLSFPSGWGA